MKKAIICGGRKFDETCYPNLKSQLIDLLKENKIEEEVCGMARGADMFGSSVAHEMGLKVSDFYADWRMTRHPFSQIYAISSFTGANSRCRFAYCRPLAATNKTPCSFS